MSTVHQPDTPLFFDPDRDAWIVRGYSEARSILENNAFSPELYANFQPDIAGIHMFLLADQATHKRLRGTFAQAFSSQRMRRIEAELLTPAAEQHFELVRRRPTFDVVTDYVRPYAHRAVFRLVGVTTQDGESLVAALRLAHSSFDTEGPTSVNGRACLAVIREIAASADPEAADPLSLVGYCATSEQLLGVDERVCLMVSFFDTLAVKVERDLPATLLRHISTLDPARQRILLSSRVNLDNAAEEAARLQTGALIPRVARKDAQVGATVLPAGSRVFIYLNETGRDPRIYDAPAEFDPFRPFLRRQLAFGAGEHSCVGRQLARALATSAAAPFAEAGLAMASPDSDTNAMRVVHRT